MDKALRDNQAFKAQINTTNVSFEKEPKVMKDLLAKATEKYDANKGIFMEDCNNLLAWAGVIKKQQKVSMLLGGRTLVRRYLIRIQHLLLMLILSP